MKKSDLDNAIAVLKRNGYNQIASEFERLTANKNAEAEIQLMNRLDYIAAILWSAEDVKTALVDKGYEPSITNVNEVLAELDIRSMEDCESGWCLIEDAIERASLKREEAL